MAPSTPETALLGSALLLYALAAAQALRPAGAAAGRWLAAPGLLAAAVGLHTLSLAQRWAMLGHGPFTTLHEILSSSLWSLSLVLVLGLRATRDLRPGLAVAAPVLLLLGVWLLLAPRGAGHLPPTYDTPLLYLHAVVGKAYLGLLLTAVALGLTPALRRRGDPTHGRVADELRLDRLAHRFAAAAFVCDSLMLIVGAVWAQDAWGRWWAWDPLESWAFVSWLALAATLHARATLRPRPVVHGWWLAGCFVLAFLTFFGVPFLSQAPHQGAI
jgi:ABC-type transport system involved in cytochrome c biogenesis permease subunit